MTDGPAVLRRRRNSLLEALEVSRRLYRNVSLTELVTFLYVCENEGLNMRELGHLAGLSDPTVSRTARGLASSDSPGGREPGHGLLEIRTNPSDRRGRTLYLTAPGVALRDQIESCIRNACLISEPVSVAPLNRALVSHP